MATVDVKGLTAMQWTAAPLHTNSGNVHKCMKS